MLSCSCLQAAIPSPCNSCYATSLQINTRDDIIESGHTRALDLVGMLQAEGEQGKGSSWRRNLSLRRHHCVKGVTWLQLLQETANLQETTRHGDRKK